ncbi:MAG: hypothetical protein J6Z79_00495 [Clostridia bacterium]|nr:hypothetical protein [Clostridia bacterium]
MKNLLRTTAALLALLLLLSALPAAALAAEISAPETAGNIVMPEAEQEHQPEECAAPLPPIARNLYKGDPELVGKEDIDVAAEIGLDLPAFKAYLMERLAAFDESIDLSQFQIPVEKMELISDVIYYALPEVFQVDGSNSKCLVPSYLGAYITRVKVTYCEGEDSDSYKFKLGQMREAAAELLSGIQGNDALTDVQKALLLHDRLVGWVTYPSDEEFDSGNHHDFATAYAGLVSRKVVCQGYALTYGYLLDQVGIENYYVNSGRLNHAWNLVYIDNMPYFVDVTWDDRDCPGMVLHDNFLLSSAAFYETGHTARDYETLPTDTRYDNAIWHCSLSAFQLLNDQLYYVDNENASLDEHYYYVEGDYIYYYYTTYIYDWDGNVVKTVLDNWAYDEENRYWSGNFTRLASDGVNLLYSTSKDIKQLDIARRSCGTVYALNYDLPKNDNIWGFVFEAPYLKVYKSTNPYWIDPRTGAPTRWAPETWSEIYTYHEVEPFVGKPVEDIIPKVDDVVVSAVELSVGEWKTLSLDLDPYDADNQNLFWYGWDEEIVYVSGVDRGGFIYGYKTGVTYINIESLDGPVLHVPVIVGGASYSSVRSLHPVLVNDNAAGASVETPVANTIELAVGEKVNLQINLEPADADIQNLFWYGWDKGIVEVNGVADQGISISGVKTGVTSVTIESVDGPSVTLQISVFAWGETTYAWSSDYTSCTATRVSTESAHTETEKVAARIKIEKKASAEGESGIRSHTAIFTNPAFDTQVIETEFAYTPFLYGDANEDETINNIDIVRLKNYLVGYIENTRSAGITGGSDANGDGEVNNKDIVRLRNYLANYNYETGDSTVILGPVGTLRTQRTDGTAV